MVRPLRGSPTVKRQTEGTYEYDVQVGRFTWWHSNGQVALEGKFEHGKQDRAVDLVVL